MNNKMIEEDAKKFSYWLCWDDSERFNAVFINLVVFVVSIFITLGVECSTIKNISSWTWLIILEPFINMYFFCRFPKIIGLSKLSNGVLYNMCSLTKKLDSYLDKDLYDEINNILYFAEEYKQISNELISSNFSNYYEDLRNLNKMLNNKYIINQIDSDNIPEELSDLINDYIEKIKDFDWVLNQKNKEIISGQSDTEQSNTEEKELNHKIKSFF